MGENVEWSVELVSEVARMAGLGWTDTEIAVTLKTDKDVIRSVRRKHDIPSEANPVRQPGKAPIKPEPPAGETYIDESGLTVTRYPARYATGALIQTVTARPRRGK